MDKTNEKPSAERSLTAALYVRTEQPTHHDFMHICHAKGIDASALVRSFMKAVVTQGSLESPLFEPLLDQRPPEQDKQGPGRRRKRPQLSLNSNPK